MGKMFPVTSYTLLEKLVTQVTGARDAAWVRFFALYTPAIRRFVEMNDATRDPDDVVQEVYLRLIRVLEEGSFKPDKSHFRTFLVMLIRHELISLYRKDQARGGRLERVSLEDLREEPSVPPDVIERMDLDWARARHQAAVEHVLTKTALSAQSRDIYRMHVLEDRPAAEVAKHFGVTKNLVGQIKFRVNRAVEAIEAEFTD